LDNLPDEYKPITVCMYYLDQEQGHDAAFRERGLDIVSNGETRHDAAFLLNFIRHAEGKRYVFSNQLTSGLLFGAAMGLRAYFYGPQFEVKDNGNQHWSGVNPTAHQRRWEADMSHLFQFPDADWGAQQAFAQVELGGSELVSRARMRSLIVSLLFRRSYFRAVGRKLAVGGFGRTGTAKST
jgi:hypothetical protein